MRKSMTLAEQALWKAVRNARLGLRFRRQQVIAGFIVDFYCHAASLVVEVDGPVHLHQMHQDEERSQAMRELGLRVMHFRNEEVLQDLPRVISAIRELLPA